MCSFTIWGGREAKQLYHALSPVNKAKVRMFLDVHPRRCPFLPCLCFSLKFFFCEEEASLTNRFQNKLCVKQCYFFRETEFAFSHLLENRVGTDYLGHGARVPVRLYTEARDPANHPVITCVKAGLTKGVFEEYLAELQLEEGVSFWPFE